MEKVTYVTRTNYKTITVINPHFGSSGFAMKRSGFGGASVRMHVRTPKSGYLPLRLTCTDRRYGVAQQTAKIPKKPTLFPENLFDLFLKKV